jgi:hypothetical protein
LDRFFHKIKGAGQDYFLTRQLFLRLLGVIYLVAFISLWVQIEGLIGSNGILPVGEFLESVESQLGPTSYGQVPTLFWLNHSDAALHLASAAGVIGSLTLIAGLIPGPASLLLWLLYLSLTTAGQVFLGFQWDNLLLETGLLAFFFAPWQVRPTWKTAGTPFPVYILVLLNRWLLFRVMFASGMVKLLSGDPAWRSLTALSYHFETQPLPPWTAWYVHQLPGWLLIFMTAGVFFVELVVPFFYFTPRRLRFVAGFLTIGFQLIIILTGNYTFFNWLTILLCLLLYDDRFWQQATSRIRRASKGWLGSKDSETENMKPDTINLQELENAAEERSLIAKRQSPRWFQWVGRIFVFITVGLILMISMVQMLALFVRPLTLPQPITAVIAAVRPFRSVNRYGLFAVMTTERPEIVIEGSNDGQSWEAYEFNWKPGDIHRRPRFVAPHQPRLDWQMWFAALGSARNNPWLIRFMERVLQGSPETLALLQYNPFPDKPPCFLRARLYDYSFSNFASKQAQNAWWRRQQLGEYTPVLSLPASEMDEETALRCKVPQGESGV